MSDYDPNIPQTNDNLSVSQSQIQNNFSECNTIFGADHYAFNDATTANRGLHKKIKFPSATTDPVLSGDASEIYAKLISSIAEPYFANATAPTSLWRGGTGSGLCSFSGGGTGSSGYLNLPFCGLRWGFVAGATNGTAVVFSQAFTTNCFVINLSANRDATAQRSLYVSSGFSRTGFSITTDSSGINVFYIAIGN